ncbi:MAG TPA: capsule biosynthesis protein CapK [Blastocatellia bacterium]|nr:capsule biosynthesis protein CapK [Blastocatellia bacterium]
MRNQTLTEDQRFPLLTEDGRQLLRWLQEHPAAPRYNYGCGDQLTRAGLESVRAYEAELNAAQKGWSHGELPAWVAGYVERCLKQVPFYRRRGGSAQDFFSIPTTDRADLIREPWSFVPDLQSLDEMIVYDSSGTTGRPLLVPSHPEVSSKYLPALRAALSRHNVALEGGKGRVSILTICAQNSTLTYASVSSFLDSAAYVKINLNPNDWRNADDRERFIDSCDAEIYSGDPISFAALMKLELATRPKALVSSAMTLLPGLKRQFETHFKCPVIDVYSLCESRFIASRVDDEFEIIPHDLYIEILAADGRVCQPGERGEITLTGGRNPFQPLLRYRTDDYAAMEFRGSTPVLVNFEGRQPILFIDARGKIINNINVTHALKPFPIAQFSLHQFEDRALLLKMRGIGVDGQKVKSALLDLFGADQTLVIEKLTDENAGEGKVIQYTSDIKDINIEQAEFSFGRATAP